MKAWLAIILGLTMAAWSCATTKPKPEPQIIPKVVLVPGPPCMEPPPELPTLALPNVQDDAAEVRLPIATYKAVLVTIKLLTSYVISESIRCGVPPAAPSPAPDAGP
jgi:hypothetical protein